MRLAKALVLVSLALSLELAGGAAPATAATQLSCPTRAQAIDSLRGGFMTSDPWLVVSFGSLVGLTGSWLGVPAGVAVSLIGGGVATLSGLFNLETMDVLIRSDLSDLAAQLGRDTDEVYDQLRYGEDVMATSWLVRVAGATAGSILGLVTPLSIGPLEGLRTSVLLGTAGGVMLTDVWHRFALWPFHDDLPDLCRAAANSVRT